MSDSETFQEQLDRVFSMSTGAETWDLSDNDIAALEAVLKNRAALYEALKALLVDVDRWSLVDEDDRRSVDHARAVLSAVEQE